MASLAVVPANIVNGYPASQPGIHLFMVFCKILVEIDFP